MISKAKLWNYATLKILYYREGREKREVEPYVARFMDRARNYDRNAADWFIANDRPTNRNAHTRGVRERQRFD